MARLTLSLEEILTLLVCPIEVHIPELLTLGDRLMDAAQIINDAIDRLATVIETEAGEIAAMVRPGMTQEEADAAVMRLDGLGDRVRDFAPTPPSDSPSAV